MTWHSENIDPELTSLSASRDDLQGTTTHRLVLFGPMRFECGDRAGRVPSGDVQRLLGYLVLHPRAAHRREVLAETLWPDTSIRARRALTDTLYRLRTQLGDGWLEVDSDTLSCAPGTAVDVWDFDRLVTSGETSDVEHAIELHGGELVPGIYDSWAVEHRAARHAAYVAALRRLVADREQAGDLHGALREARRLIATEPLDESAQQSHGRWRPRLGRYGEAVTHYEEFRGVLASELGVAPHIATREIVDQLRRERDAVSAAPLDDRPRFVGRAAERSLALDAVESMFEGRGSILCIEGEAGIGKSSLIGEIVRSGRWRGALILEGDVRQVPELSPLAPIARALAPVLDGSLRFAVEAALEPSMLRLLGQLCPEWLAVGEVPPALRETTGPLEQSLRGLGAAVAGVGSAVLVVDDLHWASTATWEALAALADGLATNGGLVIAAYRRPEVEQTAGWKILTAWDRRRIATFLSLEPLDADEVVELVGDGGPDPAEVLAITGGIPFYVVEWSNVRSGHDRRVDGVARLRRRIGELPPRRRHALESAAVLGETIPFRVWLSITQMEPLELAALGEELVANRLITPTTSGHVFTHDLVRAAVYGQISEPARRKLHGRAAEALARLDPGNAPALAYHLDRAGRRRDAAAMYCRVGASHRDESAFADAVAAWGRALELLGDGHPHEWLEIALDLAEVCEIIGDHSRQRPVLDQAIEIAHTLGDDVALLRALLLAGGTAARTTDVHHAELLLEEAARLAQRLADQRSLADATYRRADLLAQMGHWTEAREQFMASEQLVGSSTDLWLRSRILRGLAISAMRMGRPAEATRWLEQALGDQRAAGDRMNELVTSTNLLAVYFELGSWDELVSTAEASLPIARLFGDPVSVGIIRHHRGLAALAVGERELARAEMLEAEVSFATADRNRLVALATNTRGLVAEDDGDFDEAIALYTTAISMAEELEAETEVAYASHDLGALLMEIGRPREAIPLLRRSSSAWDGTGHALMKAKSDAYLGLCLATVGEAPVEVAAIVDEELELFRGGIPEGEHPQTWLWALARLLEAFGRAAEARDVVTAAHAELMRQARTISDPVQRAGFLQRVPRNKAISSRFDELTRAASTVSVTLARVDAPLGRALRADEVVELDWTIRAADDDAVADPIARRRHRLRRLVSEADRCGAAPTDDDLARALGVSRRTIMRDIAALGDRSGRPTTRRRRRTSGPPGRANAV